LSWLPRLQTFLALTMPPVIKRVTYLVIRFYDKSEGKGVKKSPDQVRKASDFLSSHCHLIFKLYCCFYNTLGILAPKGI